MARLKYAALIALGFGLALGLQACGLGQNSGSGSGEVRDPIVAATVNGRPIYVEDVRARAVARGWISETEDLNANSDAAALALEELIQMRLFAMEAEARGLDREAGIRRQLENSREYVLAQAIYDEIATISTDERTIERLYRENQARLGGGEEVHLRHIQFPSREAADAAKRRLDQGERFEALAFELSIERDTAPDGGDLGWRAVSDMTPQMREEVGRVSVGELIGPIQIGDGWNLFRVDNRRTIGGPSLEELRPRIIQWLRFQEVTQLHERLARDARIEMLREPDMSSEPSGDATVPADAAPQQPVRPVPDASVATPGQAPPPFPFPMGGSGASTPAPTPAQQAPATQPAAGTPEGPSR